MRICKTNRRSFLTASFSAGSSLCFAKSLLYGDLSEPGGEKAIARDPDFGREFLIRNADQLLFGTDVLMPEQKIPQFELLDSLKLPEEVQYKIFRGNAIKLLKLEGK